MWTNAVTMARFSVKFLYLIEILILSSCEASKLNVPRVLLPLFTHLSTNFTLEVTEGGCYKWVTSRPDVVTLSPLDVDKRLGCSSSAIVRSASAQDGGTALTGRATAIVLAEEVHSGLILRCDVIVDVIHSLSIVTTTRELFVEEAPEAFEVRAYDDQGNEFSTLENVAFEWSIGGQKREKVTASAEETTGGSVLRFISFHDSPYEAPHGVELLESRGLRANTVLLEGVKTGSAKVSVRLPRQQGSAVVGGLPTAVTSAPSVPPVEVTLVVVANLLIDPPDIYVIPGCTIQYRVLQMKQGRLEEIPMPSEQYELELDKDGSEIAVIDSKTNIVTAKKVGRTKVTLKDRYVDSSVQEGGSTRGIPVAHLKVGLPASLSLSVLPHRNWVLTLGNEYEISVELSDVGGRRLMVPRDGPFHVATKIPSSIFERYGSTENGTWHWGRASALGVAPVLANIDLPKEYASSVTVARAEMRVFAPVKISPPEVVLPCSDSVVEIRMKARGGDGNYIWTVSGDGGVLSIAQSGLLSISPGECGPAFSSEVSVSMARNGHNRDAAKVWILPMERLEITERVIEAETGTTVPLLVAIYSVAVSKGTTKEAVPFSDCKSLTFAVRVWDEEKFVQSLDNKIIGEISNKSGNPCTAISMTAMMPGTTKVTVTSGKMDDTCIMVAYEPLKVVQPTSGFVVLTVGTSAVIQFEGGPRPLPGRPISEHIREVEFEVTSEENCGEDCEEDYLVDASALGEESEFAAGLYTYHVLCRKLGEGKLHLTVFNSPSGSPGSKSSASVDVICSPPNAISLKIVHSKESSASSLARPCPLDVTAGRAVSHILQDTDLEALILDPKGRRFDNVSSLILDWHVSSQALGQLRETKPGHDTLRTLHPNGKIGTVEISCRITDYRRSYLRAVGMWLTQSNSDLKADASISVVLVSEAKVSPNHSVIFNHPSIVTTLKISDGSGHFELLKSSWEFVDATLVSESSKGGSLIRVSPKSPGTLSLDIVDLCLPGMAPANAEIEVYGIAAIEAEMPDKVELSKSINATIHLIDTFGRIVPDPLPDPQVILGFKALPGSDIISVAPSASQRVEKTAEGHYLYLISGLALGDTTLRFSITNPGVKTSPVVSAPLPVQVFPPLRLHPRSLTLVPGAVFQITHSGGPRPDPGVEFFMGGEFGSSSVAAVGSSGIVEGLTVGSASVWGKAIFAPQSASQDSVEIRVVSLIGVRIKAPLSKICANCAMPAWVEGVGQGAHVGGRPIQISPLILGSVQPAPEFSWSVIPRDIIAIHGVFSGMGIEGRDSDRVSVRLEGLNPGRAIIHLRVNLPSLPSLWLAGGILEDSFEVEVFEDLSLTLPPPPPIGADRRFGKPILMAPGSSLRLRTNRDSNDNSNVLYKLANPAKDATILKLGPGGFVSATDKLGKAVILATAMDESGTQQFIGINVEVKPIHYMMLTLKGSGLSGRHTDEEVGAEEGLLPQGLPLGLRLSYHDDVGAIFSAAKRNIHVRANRFDLTRITHGDGEANDTLLVDLVQSGETMLKVVGEGESTMEKGGENQVVVLPPVVDFIKLHVGEVIIPAKPVLTVGDIICFQAATSLHPSSTSRRSGGSAPWKVLPLSGGAGRSVMEGDILRLDEQTGVGRAVGPGRALVKLQLASSGGTTSTEVDVRPIESIVFLSSGGPGNLTNSKPEHPYRAPLVILGPEDSALAKRSNVIPPPMEVWDKRVNGDNSCLIHDDTPQDYPFRCILQFSESSHVPIGLHVENIFTVRPGFDPRKGVYVCEITPVPGAASTVEISMLQVEFVLMAVATTLYQAPGALMQTDLGSGVGSSLLSHPSLPSSQPLVLPFYPAIVVHPQSIQLSYRKPSAALSITGSSHVLSNVEVQVCDDSALLVQTPTFVTQTSVAANSVPTYTFTVHLKKEFWSSDELSRPLFVTVLSESTQQKIEVPVKVRLSGGEGADGLPPAPCVVSHVNAVGYSLLDFVYSYHNSVILVISTVVIVLVSLYVYKVHVEPVIQNQHQVTMTYSPIRSPLAGSPNFPSHSPLLRVSPTSANSSFSSRHSPTLSEGSDPVYGTINNSVYQSPLHHRNRKFL